MYEDMPYIVPVQTRAEAIKLVKQCKANPQNTCCVVIGGLRSKNTRFEYNQLFAQYQKRYGPLSWGEYPWIVGWKYGCGTNNKCKCGYFAYDIKNGANFPMISFEEAITNVAKLIVELTEKR